MINTKLTATKDKRNKTYLNTKANALVTIGMKIEKDENDDPSYLPITTPPSANLRTRRRNLADEIVRKLSILY